MGVWNKERLRIISHSATGSSVPWPGMAFLHTASLPTSQPIGRRANKLLILKRLAMFQVGPKMALFNTFPVTYN